MAQHTNTLTFQPNPPAAGAEQLTLPLPRRLSSLGQTATSYSVNQVPAGTAQRFFDVITFVIYKASDPDPNPNSQP